MAGRGTISATTRVPPMLANAPTSEARFSCPRSWFRRIPPHRSGFLRCGRVPRGVSRRCFRDPARILEREDWTGYKVIHALMEDGEPTGAYEDFTTGVTLDDDTVWGRPTGIAVGKDGALLVSDDAPMAQYSGSSTKDQNSRVSLGRDVAGPCSSPGAAFLRSEAHMGSRRPSVSPGPAAQFRPASFGPDFHNASGATSAARPANRRKPAYEI